MSKEFELKVSLYATPDDYEKHKHLLEVIPKEKEEDYLNCLKAGSSMLPSFKALDKVIELSKELALGTDDVMQMLSKFRTLIAIFDSRSA